MLGPRNGEALFENGLNSRAVSGLGLAGGTGGNEAKAGSTIPSKSKLHNSLCKKSLE